MAKRPIILCLVLCLIAGFLFTWPLTLNFFSSIPYTLRPISGFERVPLIPGDHLQSYYWYWLFSDNLFGDSALLTNPYEFNGPSGPMSSVYANFPFSLLYIIFLPLGPIGAYNGLIILSFLLSGLSMFLLARTWTKDQWASLIVGLIFAVVPYRVSHIAGGQLTGYVFFLLPLGLFFVEQTLTTGRLVYGSAAGFCLVLLSLMDPHTSYLSALTVGAYLPSRVLLIRPIFLKEHREIKPLWPGLSGAFIGGLSISAYLWMWWVKKTGIPLRPLYSVQVFILGTMAAFFLWFFLSALLFRLTTLSFSEARHRVGKAFFLFLPLWLYVLKFRWEIPRLGLILPVCCLSLFLAYLLAQGLRKRERPLVFNRFRFLTALIGVGLGLGISTAYLMHIKTTVFLPSLAGKGRTLAEVFIFSPKLSNLFFWQDINSERFVLLGWGLIVLAALGLIPLFRSQTKNPGHLALAGFLAFWALILTLGPTLTYFPLYQFLYTHFPFFNYSRVPGRFVMVGFIFLCLLSGMALASFRETLAKKGWVRLRRWLPLLIIPLVLGEYHTYRPIGLCQLIGGHGSYEPIAKNLQKGRRVLELPIWPGDSHQSSLYEYTVSRTGKPMINGYAPVVYRDYIEKVFWPLFPLNYGELTPRQLRSLNQLKVDLITFHDDYQVYPNKISPFPPRLALKRLSASPWLVFLSNRGNVSLFKFQTDPRQMGSPSEISSPVNAVFYAHDLKHQIGQRVFDPSASGFYLLLQDEPLWRGKLIPQTWAKGNLIQALPGRDKPGTLIDGPARFFPSGNYIATFRIKTGAAKARQEIGTLEIIDDQDRRVMARKRLSGLEAGTSGKWVDVPLHFKLSATTKVQFRIFYAGSVSLTLNLIKVGFADQGMGPGVVEAEELFRQTGEVHPDSLASRGEAVFGQGGYHPPVMLIQGPYRTFEPGRYRVLFYMRGEKNHTGSSDVKVAELGIASDMGKHLFKKRWVSAGDLSLEGYRPLGMDFEVPFRCEVDFRVKFESQSDVWVDRIEVLTRP
ncbi:MAG: hypothetical protein V2B13_20145 [Pseudomonadota bacterium]